MKENVFIKKNEIECIYEEEIAKENVIEKRG